MLLSDATLQYQDYNIDYYVIHRFKAGAEYNVTNKWKVGADLKVVSGSYLVCDDARRARRCRPTRVLNLHTSIN
jgi:hypothetical protein